MRNNAAIRKPVVFPRGRVKVPRGASDAAGHARRYEGHGDVEAMKEMFLGSWAGLWVLVRDE